MEPIIDIKKLGFGYRKNKLILDNIDLQIHSGQLISLLGPNGVGKSTLLNCICGLLTPDNGKVYMSGKDISKISRKEIAQTIAYVPQKTVLSFDYSVRDFVVMGRTAYMSILSTPSKEDYKKAEEAMAELSLTDLAERPISELSGGEQQKACIARALVQSPKLIILDEPTSALDFGNQLKVLKLIKHLSEIGYAVLLTTHNPDHCMILGGDVAIMDKSGKLSCGSYNEILTEEILSKAYNTELKLVYIPEVNRKTCIMEGL